MKQVRCKKTITISNTVWHTAGAIYDVLYEDYDEDGKSYIISSNNNEAHWIGVPGNKWFDEYFEEI